MIAISHRGYDTTVVAFSGMAPQNHIYEWTTAFEDFPANFIGVQDEHQCWYQRTGLSVVRSLLRQKMAGMTVFVGGSAGGFAALWFGKMMKADRIIVFCPQSACGKAKRELGDHRWPGKCEQTPARDIAGTYPQAMVHYAENDDLDAMHAARLGAERRKWAHGGHDLPHRLKESGALRGLLMDAMA